MKSIRVYNLSKTEYENVQKKCFKLDIFWGNTRDRLMLKPGSNTRGSDIIINFKKGFLLWNFYTFNDQYTNDLYNYISYNRFMNMTKDEVYGKQVEEYPIF